MLPGRKHWPEGITNSLCKSPADVEPKNDLKVKSQMVVKYVRDLKILEKHAS